MLPVLASIYSASVRKLSCALYMNEAAWYNGKNTKIRVIVLALLVTDFYNVNILEP